MINHKSISHYCLLYLWSLRHMYLQEQEGGRGGGFCRRRVLFFYLVTLRHQNIYQAMMNSILVSINGRETPIAFTCSGNLNCDDEAVEYLMFESMRLVEIAKNIFSFLFFCLCKDRMLQTHKSTLLVLPSWCLRSYQEK